MRYLKYHLSILLIIFFSQAFALTCPSVAQVHAVKFLSARVDRYDPTCWQLYSGTFTHENHTWHVEFGTFFENQNPDEVLKAGQNYFEQAHLKIEHPKINKLPNQVLLCDYMPEGEIFWVSATSP